MVVRKLDNARLTPSFPPCSPTRAAFLAHRRSEIDAPRCLRERTADHVGELAFVLICSRRSYVIGCKLTDLALLCASASCRLPVSPPVRGLQRRRLWRRVRGEAAREALVVLPFVCLCGGLYCRVAISPRRQLSAAATFVQPPAHVNQFSVITAAARRHRAALRRCICRDSGAHRCDSAGYFTALSSGVYL